MLGGLAAALASRKGWDVTLIRVILIVAALFTGVGAVAYVLGWLLVPEEDGGEAIAAEVLKDPKALAMAVLVIPAVIAVELITRALSIGWGSNFLWAGVVGAVGVLLVSRDGTPTDQAAVARVLNVVSRSAGSSSRWYLALRAAAAALMIGAGVILTEVSGNSRGSTLVLVLLAIAGGVILLGPWWLNIGRDLVIERQARIRAEERAEIASRVHDSVLQTLAMIQRSAEDPTSVARLARKQERELRAWLFDGQVPNSSERSAETMAEGLRLLQSEAEEDLGLRLELVIVGDSPMSQEIDALLAATREALNNVSKWSGVSAVSVFAEVQVDKVEVFVRDRGRGFNRHQVGQDRQGLTQSIEGRMARFGGSATILSAPGEGTEVRLVLVLESGTLRW